MSDLEDVLRAVPLKCLVHYTDREACTVRECLNKIVTDYEALADVARAWARTIALEQRGERGTPWDLACVTIADKIMSAERSAVVAIRAAFER